MKNDKLKVILKIVKSPAFIMFGLSVILLSICLLWTYNNRSFNSDDVSLQTILFSWRPFSGHKVILGSSDPFVDKLPFVYIMGKLFPAGRKLLFLEASILSLASFTVFYSSCIYFMKKAKLKVTYLSLLPFVWFASFGYSFVELYMSPIWRGFEIGLSFGFFALAAMLFYGDLQKIKSLVWRVLLFSGSTSIAGLLIYSDPYFLYFTVVPIALFAGILFLLKKMPRSYLIVTYCAVLLSLVFAKLSHLLTVASGINTAVSYPTQFINFESLAHNLSIAIHGMLIIFGADFFGNNVLSLLAIGGLINVAILGFILYRVFSLRKNLGQNPSTVSIQQLWFMFFGLMSVFIFIVYSISSLADITTYRYFIMSVLSLTLFLSLYMATMKSKMQRLLAVILLVGIVLNLVVLKVDGQGFKQPGATGNIANTVNFAIIDTIQAQGLHKGYANYWQGIINTYLSQNKVNVLPVICPFDKGTAKFHWLITEDSFSQPADRSFYLEDPDITSPATCPLPKVLQEFGQPDKTVKIFNKTLLIYNYDIGSRMIQ